MRAARFWLTLLPAAGAVVGMLYVAVSRPWRLVDLEFAFLPAARAVAARRFAVRGAYAQLDAVGSAYIYPPPIAFATIPLTWLRRPPPPSCSPRWMVLAVCASLWLLGVRDPRCYASRWCPPGAGRRAGGAVSV